MQESQNYLFLLCLISLIYTANSTSCVNLKTCESCLEHSHIAQSCYWRSKAETCLSSTEFWWLKIWGIRYEDEVWKDYGQCNPVLDSKPYNHTLAAELAVWSSLSYIHPDNISPENLNYLVKTQTNGDYRVLTYMQRDCNWSDGLSYSPCSLLVAVSESESRIIVSFEGTQNIVHLQDQLFAAFVNGLNETTFGGKVLHYNMYLHERLYPCLRDYLTGLMENYTNNYTNYEVVLTGHSLGGTQAQLVAAYLIHEDVISRDKLSVYSFGAPRFADHQFSKYFGQLVPTNWRITQARDPVPLVPDDDIYYHTHGEVYFEKSGIDLSSKYIICQYNEDEHCSQSQGPPVLLTLQYGVDSHTSYIIQNIGQAFGYMQMEQLGDSRLNQTLIVTETSNCTAFGYL